MNSVHGLSDKLSAASWVAIKPVIKGAYTLMGDIEANGLPIESTMYASFTRDIFNLSVIGLVTVPSINTGSVYENKNALPQTKFCPFWRVFTFFVAKSPKAFPAPVVRSTLINPPVKTTSSINEAFHGYAIDGTMISLTVYVKPETGFHSFITVAPNQTPKNKAATVCLVIIAITIARSGGKRDNNPYSIS